MKLKNALGIGVFGAAVLACTTNPITGRSSIQIANNSEIAALSAQEYAKTLSEAKVIKGTADANRVVNVGTKIKNAAVKYYQGIGRESDLAGYQWEFSLLSDKQLNAWCMPGGKVAVYTGILPITKDDNGMAVVLGHEISHALAGHGNERISQAMMAQYGGSILGASNSSSQLLNIIKQAYPYGAQVVLLKYGRNQELEADQMGLYLMAMAGYDPQQAVPFWQRMQAVSSSGGTPEFLSTHPGPENRIAALNSYMPKALEYYKVATGK